jgi:hypothetical protein
MPCREVLLSTSLRPAGALWQGAIDCSFHPTAVRGGWSDPERRTARGEMTVARLGRSSSFETRLYVGIAAGLGLAYLVFGIGLPLLGRPGLGVQAVFFGLSQIRWPGILFAVVAMAAALVRTARFPDPKLRVSLVSTRVRLGLAVLAAVVFWTLRTRFLNPDGAALAHKFMTDIPWRGAHVTHDEMWELYLHSRFWLWTVQHFRWTVEYSYQVLSCLAGGVFVFLLLTYCRLLVSDRPLSAFLLMVSGGYMQLFFGDVENYTLTAVWVMAYFLGSALFLRKRVSVVVPSLLLAVSLTFHLLAGFLIPSLAYLWVVAWRQGRRGEVVLAGVVFGAITVLTLLFFDLHGLPIRDLWYHSHACGQGGHFLRNLAEPSVSYYLAIVNLAFLLVPAWVLVVPLLVCGRIPMDPLNTHLAIASGFMAAFFLFWKAQLGVYMDWNLFAIAALPISFLVWRNVLRKEVPLGTRRPVAVLGLLFFVHSCSWVVANHLG